MDEDSVIDFGGKRIRIPVALATDVPPMVQAAFGERRSDGMTVIALVSADPTVEAIATGGVEGVATAAVAMTPDALR